RNDVIEHGRQSHCRLAVSSATIPSELTTWRDAAEILEHFLRVTRPKLRIIRCLLRKVIFKAHALSVIPSSVELQRLRSNGQAFKSLVSCLQFASTSKAAYHA